MTRRKQLYKRIKSNYSNLFDTESECAMVVLKERRQEVIRQHLDPPICGHLGVVKIINSLSTRYYWLKLRIDVVVKYIKNCTFCIQTKPEQQPSAGLMRSQVPTVSKSLQLISADIIDPSSRLSSGYCYILSMYDCFLLLPILLLHGLLKIRFF